MNFAADLGKAFRRSRSFTCKPIKRDTGNAAAAAAHCLQYHSKFTAAALIKIKIRPDFTQDGYYQKSKSLCEPVAVSDKINLSSIIS